MNYPLCFSFMWQLVGFIPTTLGERSHKDITLLSAKLATSFFLESFIHAKEKLNIVQWVELLTKQVQYLTIMSNLDMYLFLERCLEQIS